MSHIDGTGMRLGNSNCKKCGAGILNVPDKLCDPCMEKALEEAGRRYGVAAHAMQSGVKYDLETETAEDDTNSFSAKHTRVGINSAMVETATLTQLLLDRGVFTQLDFLEMLATKMEEEKASYERKLTAKFKTKVSLG